MDDWGIAKPSAQGLGQAAAAATPTSTTTTTTEADHAAIH